MQGESVCIRLFDPPLHEFLPSDRAGHRELAEALDLPLSKVTRRVEALAEYNPMLGMRGVRLGITVPEIYEMQVRAIFEATLQVAGEGVEIVPEIMIPLVSASREVELVKGRVDGIASAVRSETGRDFSYRLGVMVETPRAALRAGDIAPQVAFLSFGTNDLTQMTYGFSRDDAGRFIPQYLDTKLIEDDPFVSLDQRAVGRLMRMAVSESRKVKKGIKYGICGEHGGDPRSIRFCHDLGLDYVSCSPYRVPVARVAAAQARVLAELNE
jgi:pyruvate,orthophosphate dikinase